MRSFLLTGLAVLLVGCVGGISGGDDGPPPGDDVVDPPPGEAREIFVRDVYPILANGNNCTLGCHLVGSASSTPFLTADAQTSYDQIIGFQSVVGNFTEAGAPVYTKIVPGPHNARVYDATQRQKILGWLAAEVEARDVTDPTDPPPTETAGQASARLIAEWRGCLNLQDFIDLRFGEVWANKGTNEGNCEVCHSTGAYGMIATDDNETMYNVLTQNRNYMLFFFQPDVTDLNNSMMVTNGEHFVTLGQRIPPHQEHPAFNPNDITAGVGQSPLGALEELYTRTMAHKNAVPTTCGPPITD
jgi:hypothetical protein